MKRTNPAVIIISNYSLERCYHKALEKDPTALDSLKTRVTEISLHQPLDIDGLRAALATASVATTATLTTSSVVVEPSAPTSALQEALDLSSSTIEHLVEINQQSPQEESQICTPPWMIAQHRQPSTPNSPIHYPPSTPDPRYSIDEDELIYQPEEVPEKSDYQKAYERFQKERREKIRKKNQESSIDRVSRKGDKILFTGYNK